MEARQMPGFLFQLDVFAAIGESSHDMAQRRTLRSDATHRAGRSSKMNKGEFVGGMLVRRIGQEQVMTLGGTPDDWTCSWSESGQVRHAHFEPEELEPVEND
jgi:hypothetical protein